MTASDDAALIRHYLQGMPQAQDALDRLVALLDTRTKALEFYATASNWSGSPVVADGGYMARFTLDNHDLSVPEKEPAMHDCGGACDETCEHERCTRRPA